MMLWLTRTAGALTLIAASSAAAVSQGPEEDLPASRLRNDSPEFCRDLGTKVADLQRLATQPHPEADMLAREGAQLCKAGHIRPGVLRLRHAWMELQERPSGE